uniref:Uncharacterized protein n=1 Tax=Glossina pallidipes TaxID=7398 RepID=A0A1A9Z993_GLOPL
MELNSIPSIRSMTFIVEYEKRNDQSNRHSAFDNYGPGWALFYDIRTNLSFRAFLNAPCKKWGEGNSNGEIRNSFMLLIYNCQKINGTIHKNTLFSKDERQPPYLIYVCERKKDI